MRFADEHLYQRHGDLAIRDERVGTRHYLLLEGSFDLAGVEAFAHHAREALAAGARLIVVDLARLHSLDDAAGAALARIEAEASAAGASVVVRGAPAEREHESAGRRPSAAGDHHRALTGAWLAAARRAGARQRGKRRPSPKLDAERLEASVRAQLYGQRRGVDRVIPAARKPPDAGDRSSPKP
jgi:ABC-type transporter Mla MlaB component